MPVWRTQIKIYAAAIWMTDYFIQKQMTGKLLLMEDVTRLKVVDISIQDISQRKIIPARTAQTQWLSKKKERSIHLLKTEVL